MEVAFAMSSTFVFASGKGGVGKSTLSASLAVLLARAGHSVVLLDADLGLRSQDLFLGLENSVVYDLMDVASGKCLLSQALLEAPDLPGLSLLPAAQFVRAKALDPRKLKKMLSLLRKEHDFILIDCPAGLERGLRNVLNAGRGLETILVLTPDDLCVRDGEQVISLLEEKKLPPPRLLVNRLQPDLIHAGEMYSARTVAQVLDVPLLGEVPEDPMVYRAQLRRRLPVDFHCEARTALLRIADRLQGGDSPFPDYGRKKLSFLRRHFAPRPRELAPVQGAPADRDR